ncbi:Bifunctional protein GlmU [Candidatus Anstonella stagnisolia]|nr:Bifunctional protein GlmU [Candidatus Anstonella stagnisolia]
MAKEGAKDNTKVVILCGGEGTRLREETEYKPKPMVTIGGIPILWHIMKTYAHWGFSDFILCLGYKGDLIKQFFLHHELMHNDFTLKLDGSAGKSVHRSSAAEDWSITFADTGLKSQTGSRLKRIEKYANGDDFLFTYGDGVSDIAIPKTLELHRKLGKTATISGVHPHSKVGLVQADAQGVVQKFSEKPVLNDYVNGGFMAFSKGIFDFLEEDESCVLETAPFSELVEKGRMAMYRHEGFWHCMDTYKDYLDLNRMWDIGKRPWKVWSD